VRSSNNCLAAQRTERHNWAMKGPPTTVGCKAAFVVAGAGAAASAQWTAIPLHPQGAYSSFGYAGADGFQGGYIAFPLPDGHAYPAIWSASSSAWSSLLPHPTDNGAVEGMTSGSQVGAVNGRAALWHGSAATFVDLSPPNTAYSEATAVFGDMQVGEAGFGTQDPHAVLWRGSASTFVDLNPPGAVRSFAFATDGVRQGGQAYVPDPMWGTLPHAALWSGSASSFIDLTPGSQIVDSTVYGMYGDQQAGFFQPFQGSTHAAIWHGTPESLVDLNPADPHAFSWLYGTCGSAQVGYAGGPITGFTVSASIWFETAQSWTNLGSFLPFGYGESIARAVSFHDGQYYVTGYAYNLFTGRNEAFVWIGVPSPGAAALLLLAGTFACRRKRGRPWRGPAPSPWGSA
jgi:hypothetical protein